MLFNNLHTMKKPKEEHSIKVLKALARGKYMSPNVICKVTGLSLTAVKCVLDDLNYQEKLEVVRQEVSPKLLVKLKVLG